MLVKKMDFIFFKKRVQYLDLTLRQLFQVVFKVSASKENRLNYQLLYSRRKANYTYFPIEPRTMVMNKNTVNVNYLTQ